MKRQKPKKKKGDKMEQQLVDKVAEFLKNEGYEAAINFAERVRDWAIDTKKQLEAERCAADIARYAEGTGVIYTNASSGTEEIGVIIGVNDEGHIEVLFDKDKIRKFTERAFERGTLRIKE
jgi:hypothetical protein